MTERNQKPRKGTTVLIVLLIFSLAANMFLGIDRLRLLKQTDNYIVELDETQQTKDSLSGELSKLFEEYEGLKTANDTLNNQLSAEQQKIQELLEEVKKVKGANKALMAKYEKELATLRNVMRSFIVQIDSLNTANQTLIAENEQIKSSFTQEQNRNVQLEQKNKNLSATVEKASALKAIQIGVIALNGKDKETNRTDKVEKIEICCQLAANNVADKGRRPVYVRIARPDGLILAKTPNDLFTFDGDRILYSSKRDIEYNGDLTPLCVYWHNDEVLIAGKYLIDIFADGVVIGSNVLILK